MATATAHRLAPFRDAGLLLGRVVIGVVFMAHGWQKIGQDGIAATAEGFAGMGVPFPEIAAPAVGFSELIGGALLILGAFTPIVGLVLATIMLVAALVVHLPAGLFVEQGGWELVGALGAGALVFATGGPGRFSIDHMRSRRRTGRRRATRAASAPAPASTAAR